MSNYIFVHIDTSEDAMTGDQGWDGINEGDSVSNFAHAVEQELSEMYPDVEVDVTTYAMRQYVDTDVDGAEDVALDVIGRIFSAGEFWVNEQ